MSDVSITDILSDGQFRTLRSGRIKACGGELQVCKAVDARKLSLTVEADARVQIVVLHTQPRECVMEINLCENAVMEVVEIFLCNSLTNAQVRQERGSRCRYTVVELGSAGASYSAMLDGEGAEWSFDGVFAGTENDRCSVTLNTRHNVADCKSESMVKGVVSGNAFGQFRGLVYVAPDAQRTDARQQSRNIELSDDAHIAVSPQLEIYADDVKCTHGATVGHSDEEALFYMRQRGIAEKEARRLQIEGFVKDIVSKCPVAVVRESLEVEIDKKLMSL